MPSCAEYPASIWVGLDPMVNYGQAHSFEPMKNTLLKSLNALLVLTTLATGGITLAQNIEATTTTTTSEGTVSEFGPQGLVIKTATGSQPVRYISSETTNYVDENGNAVSAKLVTSGLPVTVYYTKVGDTLIATKIMVRTGGVTPAITVSPSVTSQTAIMTVGTITEFGPQRIILRTESSPKPLCDETESGICFMSAECQTAPETAIKLLTLEGQTLGLKKSVGLLEPQDRRSQSAGNHKSW